MIKLTKINGGDIVVNADEIETIEGAFDTTITLKNSKKLLVKESPEKIIDLVIDYKKKCKIESNLVVTKEFRK